MRKVIFVNGPPGSGKTTAIKLLIEGLRQVQGLHPKELIPSIRGKAAVMSLLGMPANDYPKYESVKDEKLPQFYGRTPRDWYIGLMEAVKQWYGPDLFGVLMCKEIDSAIQTNIFIYDAGFPEEIVPIVNKVGATNCALLRLHRVGHSFENDSRCYIEGGTDPKPTGLFASRIYDIKNRFDLDLYRAQVLDAVAPMLQLEKGWHEAENLTAWEDEGDEDK